MEAFIQGVLILCFMALSFLCGDAFAEGRLTKKLMANGGVYEFEWSRRKYKSRTKEIVPKEEIEIDIVEKEKK